MPVSLLKKTSLFRKAEKVKDLYFEKLDAILGAVHAHEAAMKSLVANDTSVLQALMYLVEKVQEEQRSRLEHRREVEQRLSRLEDALQGLASQHAQAESDGQGRASCTATDRAGVDGLAGAKRA
jgi:hypothetical protein